nr:hypothetical protein OG999_31160 [Streptomyces sp. NBC_00886]
MTVWVTAVSRDAVVGAYSGAAERILDIDRVTPQAEERFLEWLASTNKRWLVVLDDITDVEDLNGLWPPDTRHGYTLVTTRSRDAALTGRGQRIAAGSCHQEPSGLSGSAIRNTGTSGTASDCAASRIPMPSGRAGMHTGMTAPGCTPAL